MENNKEQIKRLEELISLFDEFRKMVDNAHLRKLEENKDETLRNNTARRLTRVC